MRPASFWILQVPWEPNGIPPRIGTSTLYCYSPSVWSVYEQHVLSRLPMPQGPCEGSPPPASTSSGAPRFEALDATRWIASTLIVVSHVLQAAEQFFSLPESLLRLRSWGGTWTQFLGPDSPTVLWEMPTNQGAATTNRTNL